MDTPVDVPPLGKRDTEGGASDGSPVPTPPSRRQIHVSIIPGSAAAGEARAAEGGGVVPQATARDSLTQSVRMRPSAGPRERTPAEEKTDNNTSTVGNKPNSADTTTNNNTTAVVGKQTSAGNKRTSVGSKTNSAATKLTTTPPRGKQTPVRNSFSSSSRGMAKPARGRTPPTSALRGKGRKTPTKTEGRTTPQSRGGRPDMSARGRSSLLQVSRGRTPDGGKKKRGKKIFQVVINAEDKARAEIDEEYEAEWKNLILEISTISFEPQRRNFVELQEELYRCRRECKATITKMKNALQNVIKCTSNFLQVVHTTGAGILKESSILDIDVPFTIPRITVSGEVLPCVRDPSSYLKEDHLPVKETDINQEEEIAKVHSFFSSLVLEFDGLSSFSDSDINTTVEKAKEVESNTNALSCSVSALIQRVHRTLQQWRKTLDVMQKVINEKATRVKVADDLLRETTAKNRVEVDSAIRLCREFGMELRSRMDAIEKEMRNSLADLIQRSTEVSIENNAFHDQAQLLLNKENTIQYYMSKMEAISVEQGKLLRDVRLKLLQLWKERCGDGDEERATLTHSGLPKKYHAKLESCDRDTLLRFLHFVTLNSIDAPGLLISALDEHEHFISGNTEEAKTVAEQSSVEVAVRALLEKLYEEGDIKVNPRFYSTNLTDTINDMVRHYSTYMTTVEKQLRRERRKRNMEMCSSAYAFFDSRTPVPEEYASEIKSLPTTSHWKRPALCDGNANRIQQDTITAKHTLKEEPVTTTSANTHPGMDPERRHNTVGMTLPTIETCHILRHLRQSHPSVLDPPGTSSVVGLGRWGGKRAKQAANEDTTDSVALHGCLEPIPVDGSANVVASYVKNYSPGPPPGVPPRISIMRHLLAEHSNDVGALMNNSEPKCRCFPGEDAAFLKLQRALFEAEP